MPGHSTPEGDLYLQSLESYFVTMLDQDGRFEIEAFRRVTTPICTPTSRAPRREGCLVTPAGARIAPVHVGAAPIDLGRIEVKSCARASTWRAAPDFSVKTLSGDTVTLSKLGPVRFARFLGQLVRRLHLSASPPDLARLHEARSGDRSLVILGLEDRTKTR